MLKQEDQPSRRIVLDGVGLCFRIDNLWQLFLVDEEAAKEDRALTGTAFALFDLGHQIAAYPGLIDHV
jgi:hypothetical protein